MHFSCTISPTLDHAMQLSMKLLPMKARGICNVSDKSYTQKRKNTNAMQKFTKRIVPARLTRPPMGLPCYL